MKTSAVKSLLSASTLSLLLSISAVQAEGNRYQFDRSYHSEISASQAFDKMQAGEAILIDVRRLREHAAGHPELSYNVPYPHIVNSNDQSAEAFYNEVFRIVGGKTDTPIMTLCRTGARSVASGNILADPASAGIDGPAFTNVQNIWEGFVGRYKEPYVAQLPTDPAPTLEEMIAHDELDHTFLDLNNNDILDTDVADVYDHSPDANPDKDGWRNFAGLPWDTNITKERAYLTDLSQYDAFVETPFTDDASSSDSDSSSAGSFSILGLFGLLGLLLTNLGLRRMKS